MYVSMEQKLVRSLLPDAASQAGAAPQAAELAVEEEAPTLPAPGGRGKGLYACEYALLARLAVLTAEARIALLHGASRVRHLGLLPTCVQPWPSSVLFTAVHVPMTWCRCLCGRHLPCVTATHSFCPAHTNVGHS